MVVLYEEFQNFVLEFPIMCLVFAQSYHCREYWFQKRQPDVTSTRPSSGFGKE